MKIKRSSDAHYDGNFELLSMLVHPPLLFRRAETDPENIRSRIIDSLHNLFVFLGYQRPKRRRICAHTLKARNPIKKSYGKLFGHTESATVEEVPVSLLRSSLKKRCHQLGSIHTTLEIMSLHAAQPN